MPSIARYLATVLRATEYPRHLSKPTIWLSLSGLVSWAMICFKAVRTLRLRSKNFARGTMWPLSSWTVLLATAREIVDSCKWSSSAKQARVRGWRYSSPCRIYSRWRMAMRVIRRTNVWVRCCRHLTNNSACSRSDRHWSALSLGAWFNAWRNRGLMRKYILHGDEYLQRSEEHT